MHQHLPTKHNLRQGERVGVWARPTDNELYLFGYGQYMGEEFFNGESHPVIRLNNDQNETYVIHYQHVSYGREDGIRRQCDSFMGHVHHVSLKAFLDPENFVPPVIPDGEGTPEEPAKAKAPPKPKTAFDKLHQLGQEVNECRKWLDVCKAEISKTEAKIADKLEQMDKVKAQAFAEVEALEKGEELVPFVDPDEPEPKTTESATSDAASTEGTEGAASDGDGEAPSASVNAIAATDCATCGSTLGPTGCAVCN